MTGLAIYRVMAGLLIAVPMVVHAAEPLVIQGSASKKFLPLDKVREEQRQKEGGLKVTEKVKPFPLRSDQQALKNGSMRIDRTLTVPIPPQRALNTGVGDENKPPVLPKAETEAEVENDVALEPESEEIEGNNETINPVLALFGDDEDISASFDDVMNGRSSRNAAGLMRQLVWPLPLNVSQYVSSGYGVRADPFHGKPAFHGGLDIAADEGTPVLATADGQVVQVAQDANYGKYVTLAHADGTLTRYGHLSAQRVREGARVYAGQVIGAVGSTGRSTGPHLDYRVSKSGVKYDPLSVLSVPSQVANKAGAPNKTVAGTARRSGARIAQNALPKRPMVIQVR